MKRIFSLLLALCVAMGAVGCGSSAASPAASEPAKTTELTVFAAASLTETLDTLTAAYTADHPGVTIACNYDSSGTLKTQIEEGAACDLFLSAGQKQMDQLEELDLVNTDTRRNLLENKVVLVVPEGNPKGIDSFDSLAKALKSGDVLLAMGNSDVPVGQYTQKILAYYGLDETSLANAGCLTYGTNVKEVTTQVAEGSVDCGIIYCTDAYSAGLTVADSATAEMCGQVIYPAAALKNSAEPEAAKMFLDYLTTPDAMKVFEEVGFSAA